MSAFETGCRRWRWCCELAVQVVEKGCRWWVLGAGAGAVSLLCTWWRQRAGAGCARGGDSWCWALAVCVVDRVPVLGAGRRCWRWCCEQAAHVVETWRRRRCWALAARVVERGCRGRSRWCCELAVHLVGTGRWRRCWALAARVVETGRPRWWRHGAGVSAGRWLRAWWREGAGRRCLRWCCELAACPLLTVKGQQPPLLTVKGDKPPLVAVKGDQPPLVTVKCQREPMRATSYGVVA